MKGSPKASTEAAGRDTIDHIWLLLKGMAKEGQNISDDMKSQFVCTCGMRACVVWKICLSKGNAFQCMSTKARV